MENHETILKVLSHCAKESCYGCPYRGSRSCTRRMAIAAKQAIEQLMKEVSELSGKGDQND